MSTIAYLRYSTDKQDERQQLNTIQNYLTAKGIAIDKTYSDEGIGGGVSYTKRSLFELCTELNPYDTVVISEVSRLTRNGIGELSEIINKYFKPNNLRLIICNVGFDIDCSDINPMIELQLAMMATFAKIEKQMIIDRTKSALDVRKKKLETDGSFISKKGNICTRLGRPKGCQASDKSIEASRAALRDTALNNPNNIAFKKYMELYEEQHGRITPNTGIKAFTEQLNRLGYKTAKGLDFNDARAWSMLRKVRELYAS